MKLAILSPCGTEVDFEHLYAVQGVKDADVFRTFGATIIEQARAILATRALEAGADVLFWIDSDIVFDPADVHAMAARCLEGPYAVLGAAYSKRGPGHGMVGSFKTDPGKLTFYRPGVAEAGVLGLGFTAVRREVFERLAQDMSRVVLPSEPAGTTVWPFFFPSIEDGVYLAEDAAFCFRASRAGFKIGMDLEPKVRHKGSYLYSLEDAGMVVPKGDVLEATFS